MRRVRTATLVLAVIVGAPTVARADLTLFIGATTTPESRMARGVAAGLGLLVIGFEFEYSNTPEDLGAGAPSVLSGSGNVLLQTPVPVFGFQPYFTTGGGIYREVLGIHEQTGFAPNIGGGVKVSLAGPLRLRVDYRIFNLGDDALYSSTHRIYAGVNLNF
jgi:hypothetical protein